MAISQRNVLILLVIVAAIGLGIWAAIRLTPDATNQPTIKRSADTQAAEPPDYNEAEKTLMLKAARSYLYDATKILTDDNCPRENGAGFIAEVFDPKQRPWIGWSMDHPGCEAFYAALDRIRDQENYNRDIFLNLAKLRIKISRINPPLPLPRPKIENEQILLRLWAQLVEPGVHGLIVKQGDVTRLQIPEAPIYYNWTLNPTKPTGPQSRVNGVALFKRRLAAFELDADDPSFSQTVEIMRFTTRSFIDSAEEPGRPVDTYRAHLRDESLTPDRLRKAIMANIDYLLRILGEDGQLDYVYHPTTNKHDADYHFPRHTGYALRMWQAYGFIGDERLPAAARRVLDYNLSRAKNPDWAPDIKLVYDDKGRADLGTNALMALIFAFIPESRLTNQDRSDREQFGRAVLRYRSEEAGFFYITDEQIRTKQLPEKQAAYFPGVALLAMVRLYETTGEKHWLKAATETSAGLERLWAEDGPDNPGDYCWTAQAWARLARAVDDPQQREHYAQLGYSHADAVIAHQWAEGRPGFYPDYLGGADNDAPPRTTPTSSRAESLLENYFTARQLGQREAQIKYGMALMRSLRFVIANQYSTQNGWFLVKPEYADGGIRGGLIANDIRIDYNQHALFPMSAAMEVAADLEKLQENPWQ